jgi:acyl dehydratase
LCAVDTLYFEDFSVGQRMSCGAHALDAAQIKAFAGEFDPQPFHLDDAAAKRSLFAGLCASGWHTAAITMKLLTGLRPQIAGGIIGAGAELDWPTAARPGDLLRLDCEVLEVRPSRSRFDRGIVVMRIRTLNQRDEVRQDLKAKLVVFRAPGGGRQTIT